VGVRQSRRVKSISQECGTRYAKDSATFSLAVWQSRQLSSDFGTGVTTEPLKVARSGICIKMWYLFLAEIA
jgi:hypothetical protein